MDRKKTYLSFLVWSDGFKTYAMARELASRKGFAAGWRPEARKEGARIVSPALRSRYRWAPTAYQAEARSGIRINTTLIFTPEQALLSAKAGAAYVSPFAGGWSRMCRSACCCQVASIAR